MRGLLDALPAQRFMPNASEGLLGALADSGDSLGYPGADEMRLLDQVLAPPHAALSYSDYAIPWLVANTLSGRSDLASPLKLDGSSDDFLVGASGSLRGTRTDEGLDEPAALKIVGVNGPSQQVMLGGRLSAFEPFTLLVNSGHQIRQSGRQPTSSSPTLANQEAGGNPAPGGRATGPNSQSEWSNSKPDQHDWNLESAAIEPGGRTSDSSSEPDLSPLQRAAIARQAMIQSSGRFEPSGGWPSPSELLQQDVDATSARMIGEGKLDPTFAAGLMASISLKGGSRMLENAPPLSSRAAIRGEAQQLRGSSSGPEPTSSGSGIQLAQRTAEPQIKINARNGAAFQARAAKFGADSFPDFVEELSVKPNTATGPADFRVRLDGFGKSREPNKYELFDAKSSATAPLTHRQTPGYALIEQYGGTVVGAKGGLRHPDGTKIPPTPVRIIRPDDLPEGY